MIKNNIILRNFRQQLILNFLVLKHLNASWHICMYICIRIRVYIVLKQLETSIIISIFAAVHERSILSTIRRSVSLSRTSRWMPGARLVVTFANDVRPY